MEMLIGFGLDVTRLRKLSGTLREGARHSERTDTADPTFHCGDSGNSLFLQHPVKLIDRDLEEGQFLSRDHRESRPAIGVAVIPKGKDDIVYARPEQKSAAAYRPSALGVRRKDLGPAGSDEPDIRRIIEDNRLVSGNSTNVKL
jgi:hypothetical protein